MTWESAILPALIAGGMGLLAWLIKSENADLRGMLRATGHKVDALQERMNHIDVRFKDCVTWEDLEALKTTDKDHERRLTVVETRCAEHHKAM